jgi:hypothetical protein
MKRGKVIELLQLTRSASQPEEETKFLKIEVYYTEGGLSYLSGQRSARGFYLSVTPITQTKRAPDSFFPLGYTTESFLVFSGIKKLIKEASRYSEKTLTALTVTEEDKKQLIDYVLQKESLQLLNTAPNALESHLEKVDFPQ